MAAFVIGVDISERDMAASGTFKPFQKIPNRVGKDDCWHFSTIRIEIFTALLPMKNIKLNFERAVLIRNSYNKCETYEAILQIT